MPRKSLTSLAYRLAFVSRVLVGLIAAIALLGGHLAAADISVHTDFPGGSAAVIEIDQQQRLVRIAPTDYPERGWRCWWYLRLEGLAAADPVTLEVGDAPWATPRRAMFSIDGGKTWQHSSEGTLENKRMRYVFQFSATTALIAWGPPFVPGDAKKMVDDLTAKSVDAHSFNLCQTRADRPTPALRITTPVVRRNRYAANWEQKPLVWIQARQHAWESGSSWVARGLAEWAVSDAPEAKQLRRQCELVIVPIMDIDNVFIGAGGKSQQPHDHNRDWSDQPHWHAVTAAQRHLRTAAGVSRLGVFVDLHNPGANEVNPFFYVPPNELLSNAARDNLQLFLLFAQGELQGPLAFQGKTIASGPEYDPKAWSRISKNWVAKLETPAVAVTLEVPWNTPASTVTGYSTVGRQLGKTLARYAEISWPLPPPE